MNTTRVIRCEWPDYPIGGGVYRELPPSTQRVWDYLPVPSSDNPTARGHEWGCRAIALDFDACCAVLPAQLSTWFDPATREHLRYRGLRFVVLDAHDCAILEQQCVIRRSTAVLVEEYLQ